MACRLSAYRAASVLKTRSEDEMQPFTSRRFSVLREKYERNEEKTAELILISLQERDCSWARDKNQSRCFRSCTYTCTHVRVQLTRAVRRDGRRERDSFSRFRLCRKLRTLKSCRGIAKLPPVVRHALCHLILLLRNGVAGPFCGADS